MNEYNEVMMDFREFIINKTPEERKNILNLIEKWIEELILGGVGNENIKNAE
jgi:hypothetical protein